MNAPFETIPFLTTYQPALLALAILALTVLIQSVLIVPLAFLTGKQAPGMLVNGSHDDFSFRVVRTYLNATENLPAFAATVFLAIIAGVDQDWVNWLAGLHVGFRMIFWMAYYSGIGRVAFGPRTFSYVGGVLANIILAGMTVYALIT
ncbi:MAPEG family protein [uncultured Brevundimonas sp.]|uniref:MAPEG family protein n=1 Tax=uncultured Brevundimonas sp. TaxID=213418 RepID=UPI0030EBDFF3